MPGGLIPSAMAWVGCAPRGPQHLNFPGKSDKLVVLGERPLVAETPEHLLDDDTTPTDSSSSATGASGREGSTPEDCRTARSIRLELTARRAQTSQAGDPAPGSECGGNGRSFFPASARRQWGNGGIGCAEWTGAARGRAQDRRRQAVRRVHRLRRGRQSRRRQQGRDLARRPNQEGADVNNLIVRHEQPSRCRTSTRRCGW